MQHLVFKPRPHNEVKLADGKVYKIPKEFTVEEVERLLELKDEEEFLKAQPVSKDEPTKAQQIASLYANVYAQLSVMMQTYQTEITLEELKKTVTHNEALEITGFFQKYRTLALKAIIEETPAEKPESKKKVVSAETELRDLRRLVTFMVTCGFSLYDLRKLYIDELYLFHEELFYTLENLGRVKPGSYDKIIGSKKKNVPVEDIVKSLKSQLFKSVTPQK